MRSKHYYRPLQREARRILVGVLSFVLVVNPMLPGLSAAFAQGIAAGSQKGQAAGDEIRGAFQFPDTQGGKTLPLPDGSRVQMSELFQSGGADSSYEDMYGENEATFEQAGTQGLFDLSQNDGSAESKAYSTLRQTSKLSKPNLKNDPIFGTTDAVFDFLDGNEVTCTGMDTHTPQYRKCIRQNATASSCSISHDYEVGIFEHAGGPVNIESCGEGCVDFWVGTVGDNYLDGNCDIFEESMSIRILNPDAIQSVSLVRAKYDDYFQVYISDTMVWNGPNGNFPPETNGKCELEKNWDQNPNVSVTAHLKNREAGSVVNMKTRVSVTGNGEGFAQFRAYYDPSKLVSQDEWVGDGCADTAELYFQETGSYGATCTVMPPTDGAGCAIIDGNRICPADLSDSPIPDISSLCQEISIDPPPGAEPANTCKPLEQNPSCGFISSSCKGKSSEQWVKELFTVGLGQAVSEEDIQLWIDILEMHDNNYEFVALQFFEMHGWAADVDDSIDLNRFSCSEYIDTYDCGYTETPNRAACDIEHLLINDFADCDQEMVETTYIEEIKLEEVEMCHDALKLTSCRVERTLESKPRSATRRYYRECFIEEEVSYTVPWYETAIDAEVEFDLYASDAEAEITQQPSLENGWVAKLLFTGEGEMVEKTREVPRPCESGEPYPCVEEETYEEMECPEDQYLDVRLSAEGHELDYREDNFPEEEENDPCFRESDNWTNSSWVCSEHAPLEIDGVEATPEEINEAGIEPMYPGAPLTCVVGEGTYHTKEYGQGQFCHYDYEGDEKCEWIDSDTGVDVGNTTCSDLEYREQAGECTYLGQYPVQDGVGSTGFQYVWEHRYDCGEGEMVESTRMDPSYTCEGIVSCMGDECVNPNRETSDDFGKAVGLLHVAEHIGNDITCDVAENGADLANCRVFNGEAQTCKQALGGYVDCCEKPDGVSLGEYITLARHVSKLDTYATNVAGMLPEQGAFAELGSAVGEGVDSVNSAVDLTKKTFTSAFDQVTGSAFKRDAAGNLVDFPGANLTDGLTALYDQFTQALMKGANDFLVDNFSSEVAGMFFKEVAKEGATDGATQMALADGLSSALSFVGTIYTIYTIAKLVIQVVYECTPDELSLGVERQLRKTHYIGTYCHSDTVFGCMEMRESYCQFSSPLARILNEQMRPQLGREWGTPKDPECQGITLGELQTIDWNQVDLTEWLDILKITETMPGYDADLTIDGLTGEDSFLGHRPDDSEIPPRSNAADRNVERLEGEDVIEINQSAAEDLWGR